MYVCVCVCVCVCTYQDELVVATEEGGDTLDHTGGVDFLKNDVCVCVCVYKCTSLIDGQSKNIFLCT